MSVLDVLQAARAEAGNEVNQLSDRGPRPSRVTNERPRAFSNSTSGPINSTVADRSLPTPGPSSAAPSCRSTTSPAPTPESVRSRSPVDTPSLQSPASTDQSHGSSAS